MIFSFQSARARIPDFYDSLPFHDQNIYLDTFHACRNSQAMAAWWIGLDHEIAVGSFTGVLSLLNFNLKTSEERLKTNMMSSQLHRKLNSVGFMLAIEHCFRDPTSAYKSKLAKQGVIVGLIMSEIAGAGGALLLVVKTGPLLLSFAKTYPLVAASLTGAGMTINQWKNREVFNNALNEVTRKNSIALNSEAEESLAQINLRLIQLKKRQIATLENRLKSSDLSTEDRQTIERKIEFYLIEITEIKNTNK
jgi:hypothetical protein